MNRKDRIIDTAEIKMDNLPKDKETYKQYHALIVEHAKKHCKTKPICKNCPITKLCKKTFRKLYIY